MWEYQNTDELFHHGILGMKWGVRRYQNKDGSLTPRGKKKLGRYIEARRANDNYMNSVYNIKNKKARAQLIKELIDEPGETDIVTTFNNWHKHNISSKEIKNIINAIDRQNAVYKIKNKKRGVKELSKINKEMNKAKKIMNKYKIMYDKPSIIRRTFNSQEELDDFYKLYKNIG